jgi:hypothetical protein
VRLRRIEVHAVAAFQDVLEQLGISLAAAKSRLLRGRSELRQRLEKYCGSMGAATLTA